MITLKPGDIFAHNYKLNRLIDTGGFAEVWEAVFLTAGNTVALKIFPRLDEQGIKNIEAEFKNQIDLLHTNLIVSRYFGIYEDHPFLEMKYYPGGNAGRKIGEYSEYEIVKCLNQISSALTYLHNENIVHQDIKPNNFMLDAKGNYFLADLGLSLKVRSTIKKFTRTNHTSSAGNGTTPLPYRAPELWNREHLKHEPVKATDIWALGASLFELATGEVPFGEFGGSMQINDPSIPDLPKNFSAELNRVIGKCLSKDTWDRPTANELFEWTQAYLKTGTWTLPELNSISKSGKESPDYNGTIPAASINVPFATDAVQQKKRKKMLWSLSLVTTVILFLFIGYKFIPGLIAVSTADSTENYFEEVNSIVLKNERKLHEADSLFEKKEYQIAKEKYKEALMLDVASQDRDIQERINNLNRYAQGRIKEIDIIAQTEENIRTKLKEADSLFEKEDYQNAKRRYQEVLTFDDSNLHAQGSIKKIDTLVEIKEKLKQADFLYEKKDYQNAKKLYKKVLGLDASNHHAQEKINEIDAPTENQGSTYKSGVGNTITQGVRINFIRYRMIEYSNGKWEKWPLKWKSSSAYAIISSENEKTYKVSVYGNDDKHHGTFVCIFDPKTTSKKREAENLAFLNCYSIKDDDQVQIWTNIVSIESLLKNSKDWKQEGAAFYIWKFGTPAYCLNFE